MSRIVLLVALLPALAVAQEAEQASPLGLTQAVGYAWSDVAALVPPPDSGTADAGHLVWTDLPSGVARLDVRLRGGTIAAVTTTTPGSADEMAALVARFEESMGAPADGRFYTADQFRALNPQAPHLDIRVDPASGRTTFRQPSAPPPPAPAGQ